MATEKVSIVIPCYRSEKMIGIVVNEIKKTIQRNKEYEYEIILVNDGSPDNTWQEISKLALQDNYIKAVNLSKNFGQHNALMAGYRLVTGDYVIGMDDDGENDPGDMFLLIDKLKEGYDFVCAEYPRHQSKFRGLGTKMNNMMATYLIGKPRDIEFTSYYVMQRFVIDEIIKYEHAYPYVGGLLLRVTNNLGTVEMDRKKRLSGNSGYNFRKLLSLWVNGFTAFSVKPLRIATALGLTTSIFGFVVFLIIIIRKFIVNDYVMGYASLMACIMFFSGMIMMLLGISGEYLGRIYVSINNAPQYVIREIVSSDEG